MRALRLRFDQGEKDFFITFMEVDWGIFGFILEGERERVKKLKNGTVFFLVGVEGKRGCDLKGWEK